MRRVRAAHLGPELRRPLVLDVALPLFARHGYDAVSMQAIADSAASRCRADPVSAGARLQLAIYAAASSLSA